MLVKTVPSKWAAPTSFIKIPACLVAGKENIATLIHSGLQAWIDLSLRQNQDVQSPPRRVLRNVCSNTDQKHPCLNKRIRLASTNTE